MTIFRPKPPFVVLEDSRGHADARSYVFEDCAQILSVHTLDDVDGALEQIESWRQDGYYCAGWLSYETGAAFEQKLQEPEPDLSKEPLIWFAAFKKRRMFKGSEIENFWRVAQTSLRPFSITSTRPELAEDDYTNAFNAVQNYIQAGDIYQANITFPCSFEAVGDIVSLYRYIREAQFAGYGALIITENWAALSFSPELFVERKGQTLTTRPMKGTVKRPLTQDADEAAAQALKNDEKSRAENLMIVDLLRNDLSRIANPGSVKVKSLFEVEHYRTVLQMTSTVQCESQALFPDIIKAIFPCGSVTGAPKIRAMEIINELETVPRGIYTGAIGHVAPDEDFSLSVPIRTAVLDQHGKGRLNVGSGLIADSQVKQEYEECLTKAAFLNASRGQFDLFETMKWTPEKGVQMLDRHLNRLGRSAAYFGFQFNEEEARRLLDLGAQIQKMPARVKLLLSRQGVFSCQFNALPALPQAPLKVSLSKNTVNSDNPFLYHKTTQRDIYEQARTGTPGFEVILQNERGEITEGSFTNVFIEKDGTLLTPALHCGLLPGILRETLLADGKCQEAVIHTCDLHSADALYIGNALRGLCKVTLV